ncbi:DUF3027 domain-containing protein [Arthrobacter jiangjiafuii]|nr:DUF3027 domain-containing protein [Arthrobacter jiangjiafuii]
MTMSATSSSEPIGTDAGTDGAGAADATAATARRRAARRPSKPDALLAAAVDTARAGLLEVVPAAEIGEYVGATPDAERLVTHRFVAHRPGYNGWHWYATVARVPRGKVVTVCEVGLLPSENAVLAPEWVPWSERVRPEDVAAEEAAQAEEAERASLRADAENGRGAEGASDEPETDPDADAGPGADATWPDGAGTQEDE